MKFKFKLYDRVRILSDAHYCYEEVTERHNLVSAVGCIGTILEVDTIGDEPQYLVDYLPNECGKSWYYDEDQLKLINVRVKRLRQAKDTNRRS